MAVSGYDAAIKNVELLQKWLVDGGAYINPKVGVEFNEMGYGLVAREPVGAQEIICVIPPELTITGQGQSGLEEVATQLVLERKNANTSPYEHFMNVLPDDVSYIPCTWDEDRIRTLQGTSIGADCIDMRNLWIKQAKKMVCFSYMIS